MGLGWTTGDDGDKGDFRAPALQCPHPCTYASLYNRSNQCTFVSLSTPPRPSPTLRSSTSPLSSNTHSGSRFHPHTPIVPSHIPDPGFIPTPPLSPNTFRIQVSSPHPHCPLTHIPDPGVSFPPPQPTSPTSTCAPEAISVLTTSVYSRELAQERGVIPFCVSEVGKGGE